MRGEWISPLNRSTAHIDGTHMNQGFGVQLMSHVSRCQKYVMDDLIAMTTTKPMKDRPVTYTLLLV